MKYTNTLLLSTAFAVTVASAPLAHAADASLPFMNFRDTGSIATQHMFLKHIEKGYSGAALAQEMEKKALNPQAQALRETHKQQMDALQTQKQAAVTAAAGNAESLKAVKAEYTQKAQALRETQKTEMKTLIGTGTDLKPMKEMRQDMKHMRADMKEETAEMKAFRETLKTEMDTLHDQRQAAIAAAGTDSAKIDAVKAEYKTKMDTLMQKHRDEMVAKFGTGGFLGDMKQCQPENQECPMHGDKVLKGMKKEIKETTTEMKKIREEMNAAMQTLHDERKRALDAAGTDADKINAIRAEYKAKMEALMEKYRPQQK